MPADKDWKYALEEIRKKIGELVTLLQSYLIS